LTWATNAIGLFLAIVMVSIEWLARSAREKLHAVAVTTEGKVT
jgi:hypothetical protein